MNTLRRGSIVIALTLLATAGHTQNLGKLSGLMGGTDASSLTSGSTGNAAGVIQYCIKNNYLGGNSGAASVKDKLLGKMSGDHTAATNDASQGSANSGLMGKLGVGGAAATKDSGYTDGANGILKTGNGKSVDLGAAGSGGLKEQLTQKVCKKVLSQGKSMVGM
jgi:hypothetical protein